MGNCCRSLEVVAREDKKSSNYSENDYNRKEKASTSRTAEKKAAIMVLPEVSKESIEEKYMVDRELGSDEFGVTYLYIDRSLRELLACNSISKFGVTLRYIGHLVAGFGWLVAGREREREETVLVEIVEGDRERRRRRV